ncbi:N-acetylmuramoyl-L-alanine amidase [Fredinandcohnia sp. QZ13]|uniref:N-acetylmuramoyl-L-alanine amidase n=1 Tax=Fredinandcohnia sp. QZ13 TaxID=3073144 RepID=UPI0028534166|nr:N-acetylmuramoyl-L-alanine amidase [Fredinandcohnia sp. QZ13]MDR4890049.1 N-acetylmuramoyl-L-alanine amidase [Fredinandcohnia sp. QZ13]
MSWIQDAGHGGGDPGAVANGNTEKVYTLEAALYVVKRLAELGIASDLTRSSDVTINPKPRTTKVKNYDKCISHHFNAGGGSGVETVHSNYSNGKFEQMLIEEFRNAGYPVRPRPVYTRKNASGGDYYYMLRLTGSCRTTILEYEFVDGPQSEEIKNKSYREGLYECVVRAICREEGINYVGSGHEAISAPKPEPKSVKPPKENLVVDGYLGPKTISVLQRYFGTPVDGYISKPSFVIKALQKWLGVKQDGYLCSITISALQKRFGTPVDGVISKPSLIIKELQRRLNKGNLG